MIFGPGLVATNGAYEAKAACGRCSCSIGEQHKRQRKLVAPVFSVTQLKALMPVFYAVAERVSSRLQSRAA